MHADARMAHMLAPLPFFRWLEAHVALPAPSRRRVMSSESSSVRWVDAVCLFLLAFPLLLPLHAHAEVLLGYLTGPNNLPVTGATLTIRSTKGEPRVLLTDGQGFFRISDLSPGSTYRIDVSADGYAPFSQADVQVLSGRKTHVSLRLTPSRPGVGTVTELADPSSLDASHNLILESRTHSSLLLRPGLSSWLTRASLVSRESLLASTLGPTPSGLTVAGSGFSEQLYRLDGVDITHPLTGQSALELPIELLDRAEVSLAGMPTLDGDVTGGVIEAASRFGGNHVSGDLFLYVIPWQEAGPGLTEGSGAGTGALTRQDRLVLETQIGFGLGGALLGDRIWFFFGAAPRVGIDQTDRCIAPLESDQTDACQALSASDGLADTDTLTGRTRTYTTRLDVPGLARLTFNLTPDQTLQLGAYGQEQERWGIIRPRTDFETGLNGDPSTWLGEDRGLTLGGGARYQLRLPTFRTRVVLRAGYLRTQEQRFPDTTDREADGVADGSIQHTQWLDPTAISDTACGTDLCTRPGWSTGGYGELHDRTATRLELRGQVSTRFPELLGDHLGTVGAGWKQESFVHLTGLTGGSLLERSAVSGGELLASQTLQNSAKGQVTRTGSTQAASGFLEDRWQLLPFIEVRPGVRFLSQALLKADGTGYTLATAGSVRFAGRFLYSVLDQAGQLDLSLSGHRSALPLWLWESVLATPDRSVAEVVIPAAERWQGAGEPQAQTLFVSPKPSSSWIVDGSATLPALQEVSVRWKQALPLGLTFQAGAMQRTLTSTVDAVLHLKGVVWLTRPGRSAEDGATDLDRCFEASVQGTMQTYCLSEPNRRFIGYSARLERTPPDPGGVWLLADYTWSSLTGASPGWTAHAAGTDPYAMQTWYAWEVLSESISTDPAVAAAFRSGVLPLDRMHRGRLELAFEFPIGLRLGGGLQVRSGMPLDVRVPGSWVAGGLPRLWSPGAAGRTDWVIEDALQVGYRRALGSRRDVTLTATVFNPLNRRDVIRVDPRALLTGAPAAASADAWSEEALPDSGCTQAGSMESQDCQTNPSFGEALEVQGPRTVQIMARFSF